MRIFNSLYRNILLALAVTYVGAMLVVWQQTIKVSEQGLSHINNLFAREFQRMLKENRRLLTGINDELMIPGDGQAPPNGQDLVDKLLALMPGNLGWGLAQPDGQLVLDSALGSGPALPNLARDANYRESFLEAVRSKQTRIGRPHYFQPINRWIVPVFAPMFDRDGEINSIFEGRFPAGASGRNWSNMSLPPGMAVTLIRPDGLPVFHQPMKKNPSNQDLESIFGRPISSEHWWRAQTKEANSKLAKQNLLGKRQYFVSSYLDDLQLHGITSISKTSLIKLWLLQMLIPTLILVLCILSGWVAYRYAEKRRAGLLYEINKLSAWQEAALDSAGYMIISTDTEGVIATFNRSAQQLLGYPAEEIVGKHTPALIHDPAEVAEYARELSVELGEEIRPGFETFIAKARRGQVDEREWRYIRKDGTRMPVFLSVTAMRGTDNEIIGFLGVACDLSESKAVQLDLRETETRYRSLFAGAGDAILLIREDGKITDCNPAAQSLLGIDLQEIIGRTILDFSPDIQPDGTPSRERAVDKAAATHRGNKQVFDWQLSRPGGEVVDTEISVNPVELGDKPSYQATLRDITERKNFEEQLAYQAGHDSLTDLPNRKSLHEAFPRYRQAADQAGDCVALLLLDLDRFKVINDTLGHHLGDQVIKEVGPRLQRACGDDDAMVVRLGGDEFTVMLQMRQSTGEIGDLALHLLAALQDPFDVGGVQTCIGASIGVACYPLHGADSHELLRAADVAMYEAKTRSLGVRLYEQKIDEYSRQRLSLGADLVQAVKQNQLVLHYQPKINIATRQVEGFEALVRWEHPELGLLYPDSFIDLVEMSEVIHPFTRNVIELAAREKKHLHSLGYRQPVAINLSPRNLLDDTCFQILEAALASHNLSTSEVELELTESSVMQDPERAITILQKFDSRGVRIAVDDFGTGYSSLAYLRRLPVSALKIDRTFVMHLLSSTQDSAIVRSTIALAHSLDLKVIAEGVEDENTLELLGTMNCDEAQGYGICRPVPLDDLVAWLSGAASPSQAANGTPLRVVTTG